MSEYAKMKVDCFYEKNKKTKMSARIKVWNTRKNMTQKQ